MRLVMAVISGTVRARGMTTAKRSLAEARDRAVRPDEVLQVLGDERAKLVGGVEAEGRRHLLRAVEVEHDHTEAPVPRCGLLDAVVQQDAQPPAIGKSSYGVEACDRRPPRDAQRGAASSHLRVPCLSLKQCHP